MQKKEKKNEYYMNKFQKNKNNQSSKKKVSNQNDKNKIKSQKDKIKKLENKNILFEDKIDISDMKLEKMGNNKNEDNIEKEKTEKNKKNKEEKKTTKEKDDLDYEIEYLEKNCN